MRVAANIGAYAGFAVTVTPDLTCDELDLLFRAQPRLTSVIVSDGSRLGLIMRTHFDHVMSGPYGYGRALWGPRPIDVVTDWAPVRVPGNTTVVAAAHLMRTRPAEQRYDDLLANLDADAVGTVSAAKLFDALASQFAERAVRDELTGLANRPHFLDLLTAACTDADRGGDRVVVAFMDLDGMKRINDSYGHQAGDAVLTLVGRQLSDALRPGEVAARLGGDEFAVLSRASRREPAERAALDLGRRCLLAVTAHDGRRDHDLHPCASVGVAVSGERSDPHTLVSGADMAMYQAKQSGGNQLELALGVEASLTADPDLADRSMAQAIDQGELRLHYQPIVRISDRAVVSMEALVRWQHPTMGLLTPDRFLPCARRAGQLPTLDRWVLQQASTDMTLIIDTLGANAPRRVDVNLSPASIGGAVDEVVEAALDASGLPANRLRLEIHEDADLQTLADAAPRLERLSARGVRLTLDDMGTGSTNLRYLSTLAIHGLKIDKAFIAGMRHNPRDHAVVKLLTDLGHGLGLQVTAEGVENAEQLTALARLGVPRAQGYHLAYPQPLDTTIAGLKARETVRK